MSQNRIRTERPHPPTVTRSIRGQGLQKTPEVSRLPKHGRHANDHPYVTLRPRSGRPGSLKKSSLPMLTRNHKSLSPATAIESAPFQARPYPGREERDRDREQGFITKLYSDRSSCQRRPNRCSRSTLLEHACAEAAAGHQETAGTLRSLEAELSQASATARESESVAQRAIDAVAAHRSLRPGLLSWLFRTKAWKT